MTGNGLRAGDCNPVLRPEIGASSAARQYCLHAVMHWRFYLLIPFNSKLDRWINKI